MVSVMEYHVVDLEVDWNEVLMMAFPSTGTCYSQTEEMGLSDLDWHYPYCFCNSFPSAKEQKNTSYVNR